MAYASLPPQGVVVAAAFFVLGGVLQFALELADAAAPPSFGRLWAALGGALLHLLVGWGLWRRLALCRAVAMIYCLAALVTYASALALALAGAPLRFPPSVVWQSIYQIPSCALLLPWLRSQRAAALFPRALIGS